MTAEAWRGLQVRAIPRVGDERELTRLGLFNWSEADDLDVAVAAQLAAEALGDLR